MTKPQMAIAATLIAAASACATWGVFAQSHTQRAVPTGAGVAQAQAPGPKPQADTFLRTIEEMKQVIREVQEWRWTGEPEFNQERWEIFWNPKDVEGMTFSQGKPWEYDTEEARKRHDEKYRTKKAEFDAEHGPRLDRELQECTPLQVINWYTSLADARKSMREWKQNPSESTRKLRDEVNRLRSMR